MSHRGANAYTLFGHAGMLSMWLPGPAASFCSASRRHGIHRGGGCRCRSFYPLLGQCVPENLVQSADYFCELYQESDRAGSTIENLR